MSLYTARYPVSDTARYGRRIHKDTFPSLWSYAPDSRDAPSIPNQSFATRLSRPTMQAAPCPNWYARLVPSQWLADRSYPLYRGSDRSFIFGCQTSEGLDWTLAQTSRPLTLASVPQWRIPGPWGFAHASHGCGILNTTTVSILLSPAIWYKCKGIHLRRFPYTVNPSTTETMYTTF